MASETDHGPKDLIAGIVPLKGFPKSIISNGIREFRVMGGTQFLSQVPGEVRNFLLVPMAVPAVEAAVSNQARFLVHSIHRYRIKVILCMMSELKEFYPHDAYDACHRR